jgi:hypothetical protein
MAQLPTRSLPGFPAGALRQGNDSVQNLPVRGQMGAVAGRPPLPPGVGSLIPGTQDSVQGVYLNSQRIANTLASGTGALLLAEPDGKRVYLLIRSARSSAGVLNIAFGSGAENGDVCDYELAAGEMIILDYAVQQNRVYGYAAGGDCNYVIAYSNWQP